MFPLFNEINQLKPCNNINYTGKPSKFTNKPTLHLITRKENENSLD